MAAHKGLFYTQNRPTLEQMNVRNATPFRRLSPDLRAGPRVVADALCLGENDHPVRPPVLCYSHCPAAVPAAVRLVYRLGLEPDRLYDSLGDGRPAPHRLRGPVD